MTCSSKTAAGKHCTRPCIKGSEYCFGHDPSMQKRRNKIAKQTGKIKKGTKYPNTAKKNRLILDPESTPRTLSDVLTNHLNSYENLVEIIVDRILAKKFGGK